MTDKHGSSTAAPPAEEAHTGSIGDPGAITGESSATHTKLHPASPSRYTLGEEIARGGMGVVYLATDTVLGREVAVKVLQHRFAPLSGTARRFADEARIAAQLQHPGIPPVHDLGTLPDGRPFLAMKLIKGHTLDALLSARPDPSSERGRFVSAFEHICQALAYAHSHRVIHRDVKPMNVMVGAFGEVQLMDWGLAKVLGSTAGESDDPDKTSSGTEIRPFRDLDESSTKAGSALGTPAYMPPEQAVGAHGKVDARSDVFGLGAILAVILTGKPPFGGGSADTIRIQSAQGNVEACFARLDACGADPDLVVLCKLCLSPKPENRPADAGVVAKAVAELRQAADERARLAELDRVRIEGEQAAATARSEEKRKRRRVWIGATLVVLVLLTGGVVGTTLGLIRAEGRRIEADNATREAEGRRIEAENRRIEAEESKFAAVVSQNKSQASLKLALEAVRNTIHRIAGDTLARVPEAGALRIELANIAMKYNNRLLAANPNDKAVRWGAMDTYRIIGQLEANVNHPDKGMEFFNRSLTIARALRAEVASEPKGTPHPPGESDDLFLNDYDWYLADLCWEMAMSARIRGRFDQARALQVEGAAAIQAAQVLMAQRKQNKVGYAQTEAALLAETARLNLDEGRPAEALPLYEKLTATFTVLLAPEKPAGGKADRNQRAKLKDFNLRYLGWALRWKGIALRELGRQAEAEKVLSEGIAKLDLPATAPEQTTDLQVALANLLIARGELHTADPASRTDALADLDRAVEIFTRISRSFDYVAYYRQSLAEALVARGRLRTTVAGEHQIALPDFQNARAYAKRLIDESEGQPSVDALWLDAKATLGLGSLEPDKAKTNEHFRAATARYDEALTICPNYAALRKERDALKR